MALLALLLVTLCLIAFLVGQKTPRQNTELMEIIAFRAQFEYEILTLIKSNEINKATTMLEKGLFLDLMQIWELGGSSGVLSNKACNQTFSLLYPKLRNGITSNHFESFLPETRSNYLRFVEAMDVVYGHRNGANEN
jgi:hypothetical protein